MARDHWNRDVGDLLLNDVAQQMNGPVKTTVETTSPTTDEQLKSLHDAFRAYTEKADSNAQAQMKESQGWVQQLLNFAKDFRSGKQQVADTKVTSPLDKIAQATQKLWTASQSQHTIWVGISKLSNQAQHDVAAAIKLAGCCGAAKNAASKMSAPANTASTAANAAAVANKAANNKKINTLVVDELEIKGGAGGGGGTGGGAGGLTDALGGGNGFRPMSKNWGRFFTVLGVGLGTLGKLESMLKNFVSAADLDPIKKIFGGLVIDSNNYIENLRQIIHETQGFGRLNRAAETEMRNITQAVNASGKSRAEFQKVWLQNLERGFAISSMDDKRFLKRFKGETRENEAFKLRVAQMKSIQTTAMAAATGLHMNADSINEMFMDWHFNLGMSALQMGEMSRHMKNVARTTGVTGSQLEKSLKASEGIIKAMKKAGTASTGSVKNVTEIMTLAEKYGVGESVGEMLTALSSRGALLDMDSRKALMLRRSAALADDKSRREGTFNPEESVLEKLQMGALGGDREGIKKLMEGQAQLVRNLLSQNVGQLQKAGALKQSQGIESLDVTNLSDVVQKLQKSGVEGRMIAANLQRQLEFMHSSVGDFEQGQKVLQDMALSPFESVKKMGDKLLEMQEKNMQGSDKYNQLMSQKREAEAGLQMSMFGRMEKFSQELNAAYGKTIPQDVRDQIAKSMSDLMPEADAKQFAENIGSEADRLMNTLTVRAKDIGLDFTDLLKNRGVGSLAEASRGLQTGDQGVMLKVQEAMDEIARRERVSEDPAMKMRDDMLNANNKLGDKVDAVRTAIGDLTAKVVLYGGLIVGALGEIAIAITALRAVAAVLGLGKSGVAAAWNMMTGRGRGGAPPVAPVGPTPRGGPATPMAPTTPTTTNPTGRPGKPGPVKTGPKIANRPIDLTTGQRGAPIYAKGQMPSMPPIPTKGPAVRGGKWARAANWLSKGVNFGKRTAGFASRHADKIGMGVGALGAGAAGYYATDGDILSTLGAGVAGGVGGRYAGKAWKAARGGGALADTAGTILDTAADMSGMPGWGENCVPVCIVGSKVGLGGMGIGGGGGALGTAAAGLQMLDVADDVVGLADDATRTVASAAKLASAKNAAGALGAIDDVAKAGATAAGAADEAGFVARALSKVPGIAKLGGVASKAAPAIGLGAKALGPLSVLATGVIGAMNAEEVGMSKAEGFGYGALTGGTGTGSMFSGMLGIKQGSNADELAGAYGSMAYGASVGSIAGPLGTAVGAAIGAMAEIHKIARNAQAEVEAMKERMASTLENQQDFNASLITATQQISDPQQRLAELQDLLANKKVMLQGQQTNLESSKKEMGEYGFLSRNVWGLNTGYKAAAASAESDNKLMGETQNMISNLEKEIQALKQSMVAPMETTAKTMEMGQQKGSIFVHDTHVEAVLLTLLKHLGGMDEDTITEIDKLQEALVSKSMNKDGAFSMKNLGLFDGENIVDAAGTYIATNLAQALLGKNAPEPGVNQVDRGILDTTDLKTADLNNVIEHAFIGKKSESTPNIVAEVSRALDYERAASEAAENNKASEVSSNLMDYTDAMKGEVGTVFASRAAVEGNLEQQKYTDSPSGTTVALPSMDAVADYLTSIQLNRLDEMITLLRDIKQNTLGRRGVAVVGKDGVNATAPIRSGVKNISRDLTRGLWDLTFADTSDGAVTTEGRGGSA